MAAACLAALPSLAAAAREPDVPVATIVAAYAKAAGPDDIPASVQKGTISGLGLTGAFTSVHSGEDAYDDQTLGPRRETTLRRGDRIWTRNANGNVHELTGYLKRRALTARYIDEATFVQHPERTRFAGWATLGGKRVWRLEVTAPGGEPQTLWIDPESGLAPRTEYIDGDAPSYIDYADYRRVGVHLVPFKATATDGDHRFDVVSQTTSLDVTPRIDAATFAPLVARRLDTDRVHTVALSERADHVGTTVRIAGRDYYFLIDSGSAALLVDDAVARAAGAVPAGNIEVRGATRTGGIGTATLPQLDVDGALMRDVVVSTSTLGPTGTLSYDGILGFPFFASALVELDFGAKRMRFGPPGSFEPQGVKIALDTDRELTEAVVRIDERVDAPVLIDTGNSGEMLLYRPFVDKHPGVVSLTGAGSLNYGIGGANRTYRTSLGSLRIGPYQLFNPVVDVILAENGAFADRVDAGNVGLGLLRRYVVTFDVANNAMYLRPSATNR